MPRGSKRVAARQAELSRKKKRVGYRPSVFAEPEGAVSAGAEEAPEMMKNRTGEPMPAAFGGRTSPAASAAPSFGRRAGSDAVAASRRNPVLQAPYLVGDMTKIGVITTFLVITLVVLHFVIK